MVEISVIIPVYNVEKYLRECLESIVNQTFKDIEIICVDDGSTDASPDILKEYQTIDSRIIVITQENRGLSAARNAGLNKSLGRYVYFIDSDDWLEANALEKMHGICEKNRLDLLIFKMLNFTDESSDVDYDYSNMPFLLEIDGVFSYHDFADDLLKVDVSTPTKFFKKELIENKRFEEGLIFEDNLFYIDYILDAERILFLDECLYNRRIRKDSIITQASRKHVDVIEIYDLIYERFKKKGLYMEYREKLFARKIGSIYYRYTLINPEDRQYYYTHMKEAFVKQKDEYDSELNLKDIPSHAKNIYNAVLDSDTCEEIDLYLKINKLKTTISSLKKENKKLKRKNKNLKHINDELLSSKSWKITAPLRKLKRK